MRVKEIVKSLFAIMLIASVALIVNSCTEDSEKDYIYVEPSTQLIFNSEPDQTILTVTSSGEWSIIGMPDWVEVSAISGVSGVELEISVIENLDAEDREAHLTIRSGSAVQTIKIVQYAYIQTDYVDIGLDEEEVTYVYTDQTGELVVTYNTQSLPEVEEGSVIVLSPEEEYNVRVVERVTKQGNQLVLQTSQGDMSNLFKNINFTLQASTAPILQSQTTGSTTKQYTPVSYGYLDEEGIYHEQYNKYLKSTYPLNQEIWSYSKDYSGETIYESENVNLSWEKMKFESGLNGMFTFDFGEKFLSEIRTVGDLRSFSYTLSGDMNMDMLLKYQLQAEYKQENDEIIKKQILPTGVFVFQVGPVPVVIHITTHLGKADIFEATGELNITTGISAQNNIGISMSWSQQEGVEPTLMARSEITPYPLTLQVEGSLQSKVSYYPHIAIGICNKFIEPWVEPRPYLEQKLSAGVQATTDNKDYIGWNSESTGGMDIKMGLKMGFGVYEVWESESINMFDNLYYQAPSRIRKLSPENNIETEAEEPIKAEFIVESYSPITKQYYPTPYALVKLETEDGIAQPQIAVSNLEGRVITEWIPQPTEKENNSTSQSGKIESKLIAKLIDSEGETISEAELKLLTEPRYKVSVTANEGGVATVSETEVKAGETVTLTATPNEGYSFVSWTVDGEEVSTENPYTLTITASIQFKANFEKDLYNGYEYVDLGLSVKWATCNVGATTPEEYGDYFAWGETTPKTTYYWSTYKYCNGAWNTMTKYCIDSEYGRVDNKTTLELSDDAAHVNWGGSWRMPTLAEQEELMDTNNCTWTWTTQNGVNGYKVTSKKNGNSIFLPAAGYRLGSNLNVAGSYGGYWSSSLNTSYGYRAYDLCFNSGDVDWGYDNREYGHSVRPVCP